jgi:SAM-dependent methyltransferase
VTFEELLAEGAAVPVEGWDFSWFEGRATEERAPWGYSRLLGGRLAQARASLDLQTGGGEVYAFALRRATRRPDVVAATESWPPNLAVARRTLAPWQAEVNEVAEDGDLPFPDGAATRVEFSDVAAVVHFLRKVVWTVPDFTVERYRDRLRDLHHVIERDGRFVAHSQRYLVEARTPA